MPVDVGRVTGVMTIDESHHADELDVVVVVLPTEVDDPTTAGDLTGNVEAGAKEPVVHHDVLLEVLVEPDVLVLDEMTAGLELVVELEELRVGEVHQAVELLVEAAGDDAEVVAELVVDVVAMLPVSQ